MFVFSIISCVMSVIYILFYLIGYICSLVGKDIDEEDRRLYDILFGYILCGVLWLIAS